MTTAFVLSGGGSLGAVQVGMLRALLARGIRPDLVFGTSIGSLNGAMLAADPTTAGVDRLAEMWHRIGAHDVYPLDPWQVGRALLAALPFNPAGGLLRALGVTNDAFPVRPVVALLGVAGLTDHVVPSGPRQRLLRRVLPLQALEDGVVPLSVMAAEVDSGRLVPLERGPAVPALMASSAVPAVFAPVRIGGVMLMDGGVADNTALDRAVAAGAEEIYVLPTGFACDLPRPPRDALGMAIHALTVLVEQRLIAAVHQVGDQVRLRVVPPLCPLPVVPVDFGRSDELIRRAERATQRWLDNGQQAVPGLSRPLGEHPAAGQPAVPAP